MARQGKAGLDYFSHDVDMMQDKKIRLIKAKYGLIGYATYIRLLEELYRENGYYLQIDEDFNILFSGDNNLDFDVYINILNECINKNLFCEKMYKKYKILTSERIQKNYMSGTERRKEVNFVKEYLLLKPKDNYSEKVNVNINSLNVNINSLNEDIGTQSKVKESRVNKKKVYYNFTKVNISEEEFESCVKNYGEFKTKEAIEALHNYKLSSGKTYKSDYGALNSWVWKKVNANKIMDIKMEEEVEVVF